ncbi:MAG TPA: hypothetical protein VMO81_14780 [Aestuariivirgaceae bacterium]|nr:hypothetical protein [Aestuariivirgaceae bacterium]
MTVFRLSALAAGVMGGAMALSGAAPASAASLVPAIALTGDVASIQQVTHDPRARSYGQRWRQGTNYSSYTYGNRYRYGRSGPSIGFGLSAPGFSFGFGTPAPRAYSYGYSQPYGYGFGYPGYYGY